MHVIHLDKVKLRANSFTTCIKVHCSQDQKGHDVPFGDDHEELGSNKFVAIYINIIVLVLSAKGHKKPSQCF